MVVRGFMALFSRSPAGYTTNAKAAYYVDGWNQVAFAQPAADIRD
jgi:hypothetical protein